MSPTTKALRSVGIALSMLLFPTPGLQSSTVAAERIYASYAPLESSISVAALEIYAKEGKIEKDLAALARYLNPQQLAQLRRVLLNRIKLSPVAVSQFLYTPIGETLLERLGQVIQNGSRQPGFYALRAALILAAADPQEGLTLLNVLRRFPTASIRVNLRRSLQIFEELEQMIDQTNQAIALLQQQSAATTARLPINFSQLPDLRRRGRFTWHKQTLTLYARRQSRRILADIYFPKTQAPVPVLVISHGLGSDRSSFKYLATQLASYGFAVAVPEHPGSNAAQLRSLLAGQSNRVTEAQEFINRPLDVKYLLDQLERLDKSDSSFQLNVQQVGVIGQSFGGYTALALAGASLNFKQLQNDCQVNDSLNVSLLLQCRALELPATQYNLRDERVKAAIAINPITSSVFGQAGLSQIQIPVMIVSSSNDRVAPALSEQILPFTWLFTPQKYLVLLQGGTHFSTIGKTNPQTDALTIPPQIIGPDSAIAHGYMKALSVAFFQTHIAGATQYRPYLSADYTQAISQAPMSLSFVQSLPATLLTQPAKLMSVYLDKTTPDPKAHSTSKSSNFLK